VADGTAAGCWDPDPRLAVGSLYRSLEAWARSPATRTLKRTARTQIYQGTLLGKEVVVKYFQLARPGQRLKYLFRRSRGRRTWAAGQAFRELGIPTPAPLGFLELRRYGIPRWSCAITEFIPGAKDARSWIRPRLHRHPQTFRDEIRKELARRLLDLYEKRIYHADTKTGNLLLRNPEHPAQREWYWIDLDAVRFGVAPTRRRVVRNLVQLNGSIGSKIAVEDRRAFLRDLADPFPWVLAPGVEQQIRAWTLRRLDKELRRCAGP
jgi:hypothetical protein